MQTHSICGCASSRLFPSLAALLVSNHGLRSPTTKLLVRAQPRGAEPQAETPRITGARLLHMVTVPALTPAAGACQR